MKRILVGIIFICIGVLFSSIGKRPWIDYDFTLAWFGILLLLDAVSQKLHNKSLFSHLRPFLLLAFASSFFWWFYEWTNLFTNNWAYPIEKLYNAREFGILATINFTTVIPFLILCSRIVAGGMYKNIFHFVPGTLSKIFCGFSIFLGIALLAFCLIFPVYFCVFVFLILFLIFDPINALQGKHSLFVQLRHKNFRPIFILLLASLLAGFLWETMNYLIPKWIYLIEPWFWRLPAPFTTKYFAMPLAGFVGYIPFIFSAFSFVVFLDLPIPWLTD